MTLSGANASYTHTANGRTWRLYGCARRGCDAVNPDYLAFGSGGKTWCLAHPPRRARIRLWWQELRDR